MEETNQNLQPENTDALSQQAEETMPVQDNSATTETAAAPETPAHDTAEPQQQPEQQEEKPAEEPFVEPQVDYSSYTREQLVDELRELLQLDIPKIRNRVLAIKQQFAEKTAQLPAPEPDADNQPTDPTAEAYEELYNQYRRKRQKHIKELEEQKQQNLQQKNQLLDELRELINSNDSLKASHDKFNAIQERWKAIGDVPRSEINNLWSNYHFLIEQFFTKVKINKELRDKDLKANLEQKITICEKTEALIMEPSVNKAFKQLQQYKEQWREIGPVPSEQNDEIWERFRSAADKIDQRRREHYSHMQEEMEQNLLAKTELCEKAEALAEAQPQLIKEWNDKTTEMDEYLKLWKSIGPVPREHNDAIWQRFTAAMSKFHQNKNEYLGQVRSQQTENYNRKIDLCIKAENLAENTDKEWRKATDEILELQKEWKTIGSVSKKLSEKVWQRFRSACDKFFERKAEFYNSRKGEGEENVAKRKALVEELKNCQFGDDNAKNLEMIQALQRQWNEIGFTPADKKAQLQQEFNDIVNSHFEKLKIDAYTLAQNDTQTDLSPEAARRLRDEIDKLKTEVTTWENNLGFLANSKQATLLKEEFDKKIKSARQRIAFLEAKLKMASQKKNDDKNEKDKAKK
ncbi:MAG: DUF349 domain-containing protein [Bacteroidales bacterium]|nr:DUF349 domain-containing protein [Bacteroidales bacterium]